VGLSLKIGVLIHFLFFIGSAVGGLVGRLSAEVKLRLGTFDIRSISNILYIIDTPFTIHTELPELPPTHLIVHIHLTTLWWETSPHQ
jgi:hypothetical protein